MGDDQHPAAAFSRWSLALSDAQQRLLEILARTPAPDTTGALAGWAIATLTWATDVQRARDDVAMQLATEPPPSPIASSGVVLKAEGERLLALFDAYVDAIRSSAQDIVSGRAEDISERAMLALTDFPWLALEAARMRFVAAAELLHAQDPTRWFLLARAHCYAARRGLENLEREARLGNQSELASLLTAMESADAAIAEGRRLTSAKLADSEALAEHAIMGDVFRSYAHSFDVCAALIKAWRLKEAGWSSDMSEVREAAIEAACTAWSRAESALDRHQQERADLLREATK